MIKCEETAMLMNIFTKHKLVWTEKKLVINIIASLLLLTLSFFVNYYANIYALANLGAPVGDILLDLLPVLDVHLIFSEGAVLFIILLIALFLNEPKSIPFGVKAIALFVIVRSLFMILTHLGTPHGQIVIDPADFVQTISAGGDLFFSAHTGLPFLLAFVFWKQKILRYFFLLCTLIGGSAVLLGHLHYSIDVFAALFISYGIFQIAKYMFKSDFELLIN